MNKIKVDCLEYHLRETFEYDYNGKILRGKAARNILIEFPIELLIQNIRVKLLVSSEMSKDELINNENILHLVYVNSERRVIEILQNCNEVEIFSKLKLYVSNDHSKVPEEDDTKKHSNKEPVIVEINDVLYANLLEQARSYEEIKTIIQKVLDKLEDYAFNLTSFGHEYYKTKMLTYWSFIKSCYDNSYNYLGPNFSEMLSDIYSSINELARRKRENNFNYQYHKEKMKRRTFKLHPPEIWLEKPFLPDDIKKEFTKSA